MFATADTPFDSPRIKSGVRMEPHRQAAEVDADTTPTLSDPLLRALAAVAHQSASRLLPPLSPDRSAFVTGEYEMVPSHDRELAVLRADPLLAGQAMAAAGVLDLGTLPASTLPRVIEQLGRESARALLEASSAADEGLAALFDEPAERLAAHSVAVAGLARRLARENDLDGEEAYAAGLLHDVGRALMLHCVARLARLPEVAAVLTVAGVEPFIDHPVTETLGRELAETWNLPESIRDAVAPARRPGGGTVAAMVARAEAMLDGGVNQHTLGGPLTTREETDVLDSLRDCPAVA